MHCVIGADGEFTWIHIYIDRQITHPIYTAYNLDQTQLDPNAGLFTWNVFTCEDFYFIFT